MVEAVLDALATLTRLEEGREACVLAGEPILYLYCSPTWPRCDMRCIRICKQVCRSDTVGGCAGAVDTLQEATQGDWIREWREREHALELLVALTIQRDNLD